MSTSLFNGHCACYMLVQVFAVFQLSNGFITLQGHELNKPVDVYNLLGGQSTCEKQNTKIESLDKNTISEKYSAQLMLKNGGSTIKGLKRLDSVSKSILRKFLTLNDIQKLSFALRTILHKLVLPSLALLSSYNWHYIRCVLFSIWTFSFIYNFSFGKKKREHQSMF